jgi:DNA-binding NarL/FixJ family response regulator
MDLLPLLVESHYLEVKALALPMYDNEEAIIKMLRSGAKGYILKDAEPAELRTALDMPMSKGAYYSDLISGTLLKNIHSHSSEKRKDPRSIALNEREVAFLKLANTELTCKEIADQMCMSIRTIDGYRETLFEKLQVKSRIGLVLHTVRNGIVKVT